MRMGKPKSRQKLIAACLAGVACMSLNQQGQAQSADALLDKLVEKGVISVKEANELREETDKNFTTAYAVKSGMPDWVTSFKWGGDLRGRYEEFNSSNPLFESQDRWRYRFRVGATVTLIDDFEVGFRLGSGNLDSGLTTGSDPISNNQTLQNNGSKKGIYIDLAYAKWSPLHTGNWSASTTLGKMENPFYFTSMVFDHDYTPEGGAAQVGYAFNDQHALKLIGAAFVVDNNARLVNQPYASENPYITGGQLVLDSAWSKRLSSSAGVAVLGISHADQLVNGAVPNINQGNTRQLITTEPTYAFSPIIADLSATYLLDEIPFYPGPFPIRLSGEYMVNSAAPTSADNNAYNVGVMFGKSGKKGAWELSYYWRFMGGNSWYEELSESDFGALYQQTQPASGFVGPNYGSGSNVKGNIVKVAYSPYDFLTLSAQWYSTWLVQQFPNGSDSFMNRIQVDATIKF
jgi:hypothetical protein